MAKPLMRAQVPYVPHFPRPLEALTSSHRERLMEILTHAHVAHDQSVSLLLFGNPRLPLTDDACIDRLSVGALAHLTRNGRPVLHVILWNTGDSDQSISRFVFRIHERIRAARASIPPVSPEAKHVLVISGRRDLVELHHQYVIDPFGVIETTVGRFFILDLSSASAEYDLASRLFLFLYGGDFRASFRPRQTFTKGLHVPPRQRPVSLRVRLSRFFRRR